MCLISIFTWRVCILCYYGLREHCIQDDTPERGHSDHHPDTQHSVFGESDDAADRAGNKLRNQINAPINSYFHPLFDLQFPLGSEDS